MRGEPRKHSQNASVPYSREYWEILIVFVTFWFVVSAFIAPNPGGPDVYIFKDAGCNFALKRGFTTIASPGADDLASHLYAAYGPGLPLLYGLFASIFGCSGHSNTYFDLIVAAVTTLVFAAIVKRAIPPKAQIPCAVLIGLALPSGMVLSVNDRPEALALLGIMVACLAVDSSKGSLQLVAAAFIAGITTLVHPLAGAFAGLISWSLAVCQTDKVSPSHGLRLAVGMACIYLIPIAMLVGAYWAIDPTTFSRIRIPCIRSKVRSGSGVPSQFLATICASHLWRRLLFPCCNDFVYSRRSNWIVLLC